ncbi:MAG: nucleotidyl transferase AbiEii/AbiGii toxin family protein [Actinomycetaceae bacterium]|nr:nucleotidyl transferase AbiEii/AbiGii toxin family protein [Actinomycetaceae bacterium]
MNSAISVKDRLKNQAAASGKTMQEALTTYGLERTVYRLSISQYKERFTLKGGIFLYALFDGEFVRATRDIDLLAKNLSNSVEDMRKVFEDVFSIECDDALVYDLKTLEVKDISELNEYHGVNVSIIAYLDRTKIPVSIDIGFDDVIYPGRVKVKFPVLLDMEAPEIYAYSISSVISEKFEAIVSLGDANSRYKDFYDIYVLANRYEFDGAELREAIRETFEHRGTDFDDIFALTDDFVTSEVHQRRWKAFLKKKKALVNVELEDMVHMLQALLLPIVDSIRNDTDYAATWNHESQSWQ